MLNTRQRRIKQLKLSLDYFLQSLTALEQKFARIPLPCHVL
ncbi:hypothetical protein J676_2626 [Acinetobacter baumannii 1262761-97]|nr:hypothetical protein J601_1982 [Acinetobacter baumannii 831240]EXR00288.1 hypothetical protein J676_2626 [Acinetobacter baumannii 1262761-97]